MCKWALGIAGCVSCVLVFVVVVLPYLQYIEYDETLCDVKEIMYPQNIPSPNNEDNWVECDCGRRCVSHTSCTKLYVSLINFNESKIYLVKKDRDNTNSPCTFYNKRCPDNENVLSLYNEIEKAKTIFDEYFNQTISCYYSSRDDQVVLYNEYDWLVLILSCVGTGLLVLIIIKCCLCGNENDTRDAAFV